MIRTLLLYDGKMSSAERIADQLCYMIGSARVSDIDEAPEDLSLYGGFCFVFNFYGTVTMGKTRSFLTEHLEELRGKRIVMVGIGYSDLGYTRYVVDTERDTGLEGIAGIFISSESQTTRAGYEISKMMRIPSSAVPESELREEIRRFIEGHNCLALATAGDGYVRCTPAEYLYLNEVFYLITEGGNKFRGILDNGRVSAAIYDAEGGPGTMTSLQIRGNAKAVPAGSAEYSEVMAAKQISDEDLRAMPVTLFVIRITPLRYEMHDPSYATRACDADQSLDTAFLKKRRKAGREYVSRERTKGQPSMTILGDDGSEREVTIPEVSLSGLEEEERRNDPEASGEEERRKRRAAARRKNRAARRREEDDDLTFEPLFDEDEDEEDPEKEKEKVMAAERRERKKSAPDKKKSRGGMFSRLGKILQLDDDEDADEESAI